MKITDRFFKGLELAKKQGYTHIRHLLTQNYNVKCYGLSSIDYILKICYKIKKKKGNNKDIYWIFPKQGFWNTKYNSFKWEDKKILNNIWGVYKLKNDKEENYE